MSADDHARRLLDQAAQLQQQGRLDQAAELCRTLLAAQPRHGGALHLLGVIAFRVPGKLMWESKNMRFTNSEEANKLLRPVFRKGWELKL